MKRKKAIIKKQNNDPKQKLTSNNSDTLSQPSKKFGINFEPKNKKLVDEIDLIKTTSEKSEEVYSGQASKTRLPNITHTSKIRNDLVKTSVAITISLVLLFVADYLQIDLWLNKLI